MVCPNDQNGGLEPVLFDFKELPLWSAANADEAAQDPPMIDVDLSNVVHETSPSTSADDPLGLNFRGSLEQL